MINRCLMIMAFTILACNYSDEVKGKTATVENPSETNPGITEWQAFRHAIDSICTVAPAYLKQKKFNSEKMLIAGLGTHSGLPRMVLVDIKSQTILDSGCVAHGYGSERFSNKAVFSNINGSYCSSVGRYRIGKPYNGNFGKSYKLHGLDSSNSNAFERLVVLHSYICVPETPSYPEYICNSQGCPMVAPGFLKRLYPIIDASAKPMLLWILE